MIIELGKVHEETRNTIYAGFFDDHQFTRIL